MCRSNRADYSCQRKKLVGERHGINAVDHELALADHVHQLNADEYSPSGPARFEVEYPPSHPLDGAIILLDEVLKLLYLDHKDRHAAVGVDCIYGRVVSAAFCPSRLCLVAVHSQCLVEEALGRGHVALGRQQEVEVLPCLSMKLCRCFY
jgi:hypothetical protein